MTPQNKIYQDFYNEKITLEVAVKKLRGLGLNMVADYLYHTYKD